MTDKKRILKITWDAGLQISKGDEVEILRGIVYNESNIRASLMSNITTGREEKSRIEGIAMTRNPTDIKPPIKGIVQEIKARSGETVFDLVVGVGIIEVGLGKLLKEASKFLDNEIVERCIRKKEAEDILTSAFRILEERIRAKIGASPECCSVDLVKEAFNPQTGKLVFGDTGAERQGLLLLFMSSFMLFRNPSAHRFIQDYSDFEIFEIVCLVNLLLKILEKSQIRIEEKKKGNNEFRKSAKKPQKRALRGDYAVMVTEDVYGKLFGAINSIILALTEKAFYYVGFQEWMLMKDDHRYNMVKEKFRERLDRFLERLEKYSSTVIKVRQDIIPEIVIVEIERIFGIKTDRLPTIEVKYKKGRKKIGASVNIENCLISGMNPIECATRNVILTSEELSESIFWFEIVQIGNAKPIKFENRRELDELLDSSGEKLGKTETYTFMVEENTKLFEEAKELKQEIANRIEELWKI